MYIIFPHLYVEIFLYQIVERMHPLYISVKCLAGISIQRNHSHLVVEGITTFTISADTCPVKITTMRKRLFYADCHFLLLSLCDIYKKSFCSTESFSDQLSPLHSHIDAKFLKMLNIFVNFELHDLSDSIVVCWCLQNIWLKKCIQFGKCYHSDI